MAEGKWRMAVILCGRVVQFLLMLAMLRVATTLLSPEEMGRVALVLATIGFFTLFLISPVGTFINRRLHGWQSSGVARYYLVRYVTYLLLVAFFAAACLSVFYVMGAMNFGLPYGWLILLVCGSLIFNTINQTAIPSLNLLGDSTAFIALSVATIAVGFVCAVLLAQGMQPEAQYWLLGLLIGQLSVGVIGARLLLARLPQTRNSVIGAVIGKRHRQALFGFAWPVAIAAGLGWMQGQGYRYLMEDQLGLAYLGLFVAGYGISAGILAGFESVVTAYFQPRLFRDANMGSPNLQALSWRRYAAAVVPPLLLTVGFIVILAPELTRILLGEKFQPAADFVIWGGLAEAARVLVGVYSLIAHVHMRTRWLIVPNLIGAVLSIALCILLMPSLGANGIGAALAISGFAMVAAMHRLMARHVGGGMAVRRPALTVLFFVAALWGFVYISRYVLEPAGWGAIALILGLAGSLYCGLQFILLRRHLDGSR